MERHSAKHQARLVWGGANPPQITRHRIHVITLSKEWGIWTEALDTDVTEVEEVAARAKIRLLGQSEIRLTILRRPQRSQSQSAKLCACTSRGALRLERGLASGFWQTQLTLNGPEQIDVSLSE